MNDIFCLSIKNYSGICIIDADDSCKLTGLTVYYNKITEYFTVHLGKGRLVSLHKFLVPHDNWLDHKNRFKFDNRKSNIRFSNPSLNIINTPKYKLNGVSTSVFKGVWFDKGRNKWQAYINRFGRRRHLGRFKTEIEAAEAYNRKAVEIFGEHACLNIF